MTIFDKRYLLSFIVLASVLTTATAQARIGDYLYACQVTTINERQGYVTVRADTIEEASKMASRAQDAPTRLETREPVKDIVECVLLPDGRFTDVGFQDWVDNVLPR